MSRDEVGEVGKNRVRHNLDVMGITSSILNFNLCSMRSIEECLGDLTCAFKSLQLLHGEWYGEGRSGSETQLERN